MKNTKKLLMILSAAVVLLATAFAVVSGAVVAGEGTTINEYKNMKRVEKVNFEDGKNTYSLANKGNLPSAADQANSGKATLVNNIWQGAPDIYGGELSKYFYMLDYSYNSSTKADLYIQPVLGVLNNVDKTPTNGFVSEFDIAFFSPTEIAEYTEKLIPKLDENGEPVTDADGNPVMVVEQENVYDAEGKPVYETEKDAEGNPLYVEERDSDGNIVYEVETDSKGNTVYEKAEDGSDKLDENNNKIPVYKLDKDGNKIPVRVLVYKTDADGKKINVTKDVMIPVQEPLYKPAYNADGTIQRDAKGNTIFEKDADGNNIPMLDEKGNVIMVDKVIKKDFVNISGSFNIGMYNTTTLRDGKVDLIYMTGDGNRVKATFGSKATPNLMEGAAAYYFSADQWYHITIQYNAETMMTYVYISPSGVPEADRTLVGEFSAMDDAENQGGAIVPVYPLSFRMGGTLGAGRVGIDNLLSYQGTTVHDPDLVQKMDEDEMFLYFMETLDSDANGAVVRYQAYTDIKEYVIGNYCQNGVPTVEYGNPNYQALVDAVNLFLSYDKDEKINESDEIGKLTALVNAVKQANADEFTAFVNRVGDVKRSLSNTAEREAKINMADEFLTSVGTMINRTDANYTNAIERLKVYRQQVTADINANSFVSNMTIFMRSVEYGATVDRLEAHYNKAKASYEAGVTVPSEIQASDSTGYSNLVKALANYLGSETQSSAEELIAIARKDENSVRFINIINLIKVKSTGSWQGDVDANNEVENLWYRAFSILRDQPYNPEYEGFAAAEVVYDSANEFFYAKLQKKFITDIKAKLDTYNSAENSYIDKAGICTYVDLYIAENQKDFDPDNAELKREIERNETYKAQLPIIEGDYKNLLTQNTTKFVNTMKKAAEYVSYADLKPLYDEATEYYYSMDLVGDDINAYLESYELLRQKMNTIEASCDTFIYCANELKTETDRDVVFALLSEAKSCMAGLDDSYEGIGAAKAAYNDAYAKYTANAESINSQLEETLNVAASVRGNWDFDAIVSFVKNLFN